MIHEQDQSTPEARRIRCARYLDDDEAIAECMTAVLEADDPDLLLLALSDVARAKGVTQVAKDCRPGPGKPLQGTCARGEASLRDSHEGGTSIGRQVHRATDMSAPGRHKREYQSAHDEGTPVSRPRERCRRSAWTGHGELGQARTAYFSPNPEQVCAQ